VKYLFMAVVAPILLVLISLAIVGDLSRKIVQWILD
jgi:hypothetical protein